MEHKVYYDEEHEIGCMEIRGDLNKEDAGELVSQTDKILAGKEKRYLIIDLSSSPTLKMDKETRRVIQEMGAKFDLARIAFVGATPSTRMLAKIMMAVMGKGKDCKFVNSYEETYAWLKEKA